MFPSPWKRSLKRQPLVRSRPSLEALEDRTLPSVATPVIDLFVGYTTAAKNEQGGTTQIVNFINGGVANLNQYLANSQINETVRLVGTMEVTTFNETGNNETTLHGLTGFNGRGAVPVPAGLQPLRDQREAVGADLVTLLTSQRNSPPGIAWTTPIADLGYAVTTSGPFIHELGHNLGAQHGASVPVGSERFYTTTQTSQGSPDIPFFSNPDVTFRGEPTGTAQANNARVMNQNAKANAGLRPTNTPDATGPRAGLGPVVSVNGSTTITFKVIYYDDGGVDVDSLAGSMIQVTGPGGFSASATFAGLSTKAGGDPSAIVPVTAATFNAPVIVANYSVNTPGPVGDLGAYTFAIGANPVKDQAGNTVGAEPLLNASGLSQAGQQPLLPTYSSTKSNSPRQPGTSTGMAADLGDLAGRTTRVADFAGFMGNAEAALYRFSLSGNSKLTFKTTGTTISTLNVYQDTNKSGTISPIFFLPGVQAIEPGADGSYDLTQGDDYYVLASTRSGASGPFTLTIATPGGAAPAPAPGTLGFSTAEYSVSQSGGAAVITINRTSGTGGSVSIDYATRDGTATDGQDYSATNGTLTFADGESSKTFSIPIIKDPTNTGPETINLTLSNATGGATLSQMSTAVLNVQKDPGAPVGNAGTLQFSQPTFTITQNGPTAQIIVSRSGGDTGPVTIQYATSDGTATEGDDYVPAEGTLTFDPGQTSASFSIPVRKDPTNTGTETVNLTLSNPGGGATLGTQTTAQLNITYVAPAGGPGALEFSTADYTLEGSPGSSIEITVTRPAGSTGDVTFDWKYTGPIFVSAFGPNTPLTYTFTGRGARIADGETSTTITVPAPRGLTIIPGADEQPSTVQLSLLNPGGGATLGAQATANLTLTPGGFALQGKVVGGYQEGSTVFIDLNSDGVLDDDEPSTVTKADGSFNLPYSDELDLSEAQLVALGGTNTATGLSVVVPFSAPIGSGVITPFTTLIQTLVVHNGLTEEEAQAQVREVFGLSSNVDLLYLDPIAAVAHGDAEMSEGASVYRAEVGLNVLVTQAASLAAGAENSTDLAPELDQIWTNLADLVSGATTFPDLTDAAAVEGLLTSLLANTGPTLDPAIVTGAANILAGQYQLLAETPLPVTNLSHGGGNFLDRVSQAEQVAENLVAPELNKLARGEVTVVEAEAAFSKANLSVMNDAADVGDVEPISVTVANMQVMQRSTNGLITFQFEVSLDKVPSSVQPVSIDYTTEDGTATEAAGDYVPTSGTLTWAAGDVAPKFITVQVPASAIGQATDRAFKVILSNPRHAVLNNDIAVGVILKVAAPPVRLTARLVTKKVGKKKVTFVRVTSSEGGPPKDIRSPLQGPTYTALKVIVMDTNGDGSDDSVAITGKRGKKKKKVVLAV